MKKLSIDDLWIHFMCSECSEVTTISRFSEIVYCEDYRTQYELNMDDVLEKWDSEDDK